MTDCLKSVLYGTALGHVVSLGFLFLLVWYWLKEALRAWWYSANLGGFRVVGSESGARQVLENPGKTITAAICEPRETVPWGR